MAKTDNIIRVAAFVDGFNVYHFIHKTKRQNLKWLDYWKLSERFLPRQGRLISVQYFTARAKWDHKKTLKHDIYIRALQYSKVQVHIGHFKATKKLIVVKNEASRRVWNTSDGKIPGSHFFGYSFEEKKTDVNIACEMLKGAALNNYDTAILFSGDTDFEPAIHIVQNTFHKKVIVVVPNKHIAGSLKQMVPKGSCVSLRENDLALCTLSDPILLELGKQLTCPNDWK